MSEQRMNPEIKARWVAALRSGEYKQGKGELRSADDKFCCLGVLCDLKGADGWTRDEESSEGHPFGYLASACFDYPPAEVFRFAGATCELITGPEVCIDGKTKSVAEHNDEGRTFAEIADAIEAQL